MAKFVLGLRGMFVIHFSQAREKEVNLSRTKASHLWSRGAKLYYCTSKGGTRKKTWRPARNRTLDLGISRFKETKSTLYLPRGIEPLTIGFFSYHLSFRIPLD